MSKVKSRLFDYDTKLESVTIVDEFGAQMVVQHALDATDAERAQAESDAMALMDANAAKMEDRVSRVRK